MSNFNQIFMHLVGYWLYSFIKLAIEVCVFIQSCLTNDNKSLHFIQNYSVNQKLGNFKQYSSHKFPRIYAWIKLEMYIEYDMYIWF